MSQTAAAQGRASMTPSQAGLRRSFDIYYRDAARRQRMDRLNAVFVAPGDLVFDIGAHVGDRTGSFLRRGARVVAAEPQPRVFRALRLIHGRAPGARLLRCAVGASEATLSLHLNSRNPTVATLAEGFVAAAAGAPGWEGQVWDGAVQVPVTTLDALIAAHGRPAFVKIDVEGHEAAVLAGLSQPLPALSFEITTLQRGVAGACLDRLETLGRYRYNLSLGEDHALRHDPWLTAPQIRQVLADLPQDANSGDVFARWAAPG